MFQRMGATADWQQVSSFGALSFAFANDGTIYAAGGFVFSKSVDGGVSWQSLTGIGSRYVVSVAVDPTSSDIVYAVAQDAFLKSRDGGSTWQSVGTGLPTLESTTHTVLVDPLEPSTLYLSDPQAGVYASSDGGSSWAAANSGLPCCVSSLALAPGTPPTLYAGSFTEGVFQSTDGGLSWFRSSDGLGGNGVTSIAVDPIHADRIYVATASGYSVDPSDLGPLSPFGAYRSDDGGATWSEADAGLPTGAEITAFAVSPSASLVYAATGGVKGAGVYKSTDHGTSWQSASQGLRATCVTRVLPAATNPTTVYAGRSQDLTSISSTADLGQSWTALHLNIDSPYINRMVADPSDPATFYAITGLVFKTSDGGENWATLSNLNSTILDLAVDPASPQTLYAAGRGVAKSADGGTTWVTVQDATATRGYMEGVAVDPSDSAVFALYEGALFKSNDAGSTWKEISLNPPAGVFRFVLADTTPATLFAAARDALYVSRDGGRTWQATLTDANGESTRVVALVPDPANSQRVYALSLQTGSDQVFRTDDGGRTWMPTGNPIHFAAIDLAVDPNDPDILYTGSLCQGAYKLQQEPSQSTPGSGGGGGGCAVGSNSESGFGLGMLAVVGFALVRRRRSLTPPASTH
jgi:MYXO-CTERM domain-containing protein